MDMNGVERVIDIRKYRVPIYESIRKNEKKVPGLSVVVKEFLPEYVKIVWKKNGKSGSFKVRAVEFDKKGHVAVDGFPSRGERVIWFVCPHGFVQSSDTIEGAIDGVISGFVA